MPSENRTSWLNRKMAKVWLGLVAAYLVYLAGPAVFIIARAVSDGHLPTIVPGILPFYIS